MIFKKNPIKEMCFHFSMDELSFYFHFCIFKIKTKKMIPFMSGLHNIRRNNCVEYGKDSIVFN